MPVMAIYRRNDISAELYNRYRASVAIDTVPGGSLAHAYGRVEPGFVAVDIWEDRASLDAFIRDVAAPATAALGVAFEPPEIIEIGTFVTTPGAQRFTVPFATVAEPA